LPVILYSVPVFTGYDLPLEVVRELAEHPNIIGIKESGGDVEKIHQIAQATAHIKREVTVTEVFEAVTARMLSAPPAEKLVAVEALAGSQSTGSAGAAAKPKFKTRNKNTGFQILAGSAHLLLPSLNAGAAGAVVAFADVAPTACFEIFAAWKDRDEKLAREKQERIATAARRIVSFYGIPGIKYGQDLNGYYGGAPRLPLLPLTADAKAEIADLLRNLRN
jgi:dihydrodipicolinate synthase/N-acetylneuraminate lyase